MVNQKERWQVGTKKGGAGADGAGAAADPMYSPTT